ncbi:septum site-determining protein Ssd [Tessaracoccus caeni]|uniref:septum site-determining protein Ssd n=1 Tax=Tessaracoccus caeni TaxID=3031239 RepID=UPI0023DC3953|nr:septum site-determining protein Ssd [Tessaracoccus caeni]MDF1487670.1 hypothetical protein [Tessaracoccus caeni]
MTHVLLCARDESLIEAVETTAIALGVELTVAGSAGEAAARWSDSAVRLISPELATGLSRLGPLPGSAYLVGRVAADLVGASSVLELPVLVLPDGGSRLAEVIASATSTSTSKAKVVALVGASGGLGTSTMAAALSLTAADQGSRVALVELDPCGGGLDLLLGAETQRGFRWPDLLHAAGELEDLRESLPSVDGVAVVSAQRSTHVAVSPASVSAVLGSLRRTNDYVFLDCGREPRDHGAEADEMILLVGADVRGVSAARMRMATSGVSPTVVMVRSGVGRRVPAGAVADAIGLPLLAEVRHDAAVPKLAELGLPPRNGRARRLKRDVAAAWKGLRDDR